MENPCLRMPPIGRMNPLVLGQFQGDGWYNAGRNIDLGDVSGYTKAPGAGQPPCGPGYPAFDRFSDESVGPVLFLCTRP